VVDEGPSAEPTLVVCEPCNLKKGDDDIAVDPELIPERYHRHQSPESSPTAESLHQVSTIATFATESVYLFDSWQVLTWLIRAPGWIWGSIVHQNNPEARIHHDLSERDASPCARVSRSSPVYL
jgi:hypothetical protein